MTTVQNTRARKFMMAADNSLALVDRVVAILDALQRVGLDADQALAQAGISATLADLHRGDRGTMSAANCTAVVRAATDLLDKEAARRSGVPPLPPNLHLMMWRSAMSCESLANILGGLQLMSDLLGGTAGLGPVHIEHGDAITILSSSRSQRDPVNFLSDLFLLLSMRNMLSWMVRKNLPLKTVSLPYPPDYARYVPEGFVECGIRWDQPHLAMSHAAPLLESLVARTDDDFDALQRIVPLLIDEVGELGPFTAQIGRIVDDAISRGLRLPQGPQIARNLHCSAATLRRRLSEEGTSLRAIKNHRRRQWAILLLRRHTIPEVALRIGFLDETAFSRAFRSWTGYPPSSYGIGARRGSTATTPD